MATMASEICVVCMGPNRVDAMPAIPYMKPAVGFDARAGTTKVLTFFSFLITVTVSVVWALAKKPTIIKIKRKKLHTLLELLITF